MFDMVFAIWFLIVRIWCFDMVFYVALDMVVDIVFDNFYIFQYVYMVLILCVIWFLICFDMVCLSCFYMVWDVFLYGFRNSF